MRSLPDIARNTLVSVTVAATVVGGCATAPRVGAGGAQGAAGSVADPAALIQLRHAGCEDQQDTGSCARYSISIYVDGGVQLAGAPNSGAHGNGRARLKPQDVSGLISQLDRMGFLDTADNCCSCPDVPPVPGYGRYVIDYRPGSMQKEVLDEERCYTTPQAIRDLERRIEAIVAAATAAGDQKRPPSLAGVP